MTALPKSSNLGLPAYSQDPFESQSPERLEKITAYATALAEWKQTKRALEVEKKRSEETLDERELESLEKRDLSTDPKDYQNVPSSFADFGVYTVLKGTHLVKICLLPSYADTGFITFHIVSSCMSLQTERTNASESPLYSTKVQYGAVLIIGLLLGVVTGVGLSEFVLSGSVFW